MRVRVFGPFAPEPDPRPTGALRFADPSAAEFPRHIQTFNEPESRNATGTCRGIDSTTGTMVPWGDMHPADTWAAMNRKRGLSEGEDQ